MKNHLAGLLICFSMFANAQSAEDLFRASDTKVYWLGIDFSHVQLVGDFSQFNDAGEKSSIEVKNKYFPAWNNIVLHEAKKYDVKGMLRKENLTYDIDMMADVNSKAATEELETSNPVEYRREDIEKFVKRYKSSSKDGIGVAFVAESLNKIELEAWYHFVAIDLATNKILVYDRIKGKPAGIGLRNYWANTIYDVIKEIKSDRYKQWKNKYAK
jgi:hypothetical protein